MTLDLPAVYRDLHADPELSFQEHRTAAVVADALRRLGPPEPRASRARVSSE